MQSFKATDAAEKKFQDIAMPLLDAISLDRSAFVAGAYTCWILGDVLYVLKASPMAGVITQDAFRMGFYAIHDMFTRPGTFEFYLKVFRAIFGDSVEVTFTRPAPGKLEINVESLDIVQEPLMARRIVNNAYVYEALETSGGEEILFQGTQGIKNQSEMDALMRELYPAGVWVETTLIIT